MLWVISYVFMKQAFLIILFYPGVLLGGLFGLGACKAPAPPPGVEAVYPTADTLPENVLRMYVTFSTPMKVQGNLERIALLDPGGNEVEGAIFNNAYELWDHDQKQWTLIFDPARIKTGLVAHETLGRVLVPGHTYQLVIRDLEDVNHRPMVQPYIKHFHVAAADTTPPDIDLWDITAPQAGSLLPLVVTFPDIIDWFSLQQRLVLIDRSKDAVRGQVAVGTNETVWLFRPEDPWVAGEYTLYINTRLADPAGNNLNGLFDHKTGSLNYEQEGETIRLPVFINE